MFEGVFHSGEPIEELWNEYDKYFSDVIIDRGEAYYQDGRVTSCTKLGDLYVANVRGSVDYTVRIQQDGDELVMSCSCPYDGNCKHEYATLLAIDNEDYDIKELKPYIARNDIEVKDLMKKIPADELKKYMINHSDGYVFDMDLLEKEFMKYMPKQEYDYYYNNLYNRFLLEDDAWEEYDHYIDSLRRLLECGNYEEAFYIIKSIVEIGHDLDLDIIHDYPTLGMYLRIVYRKSEKSFKKVIEKYIMDLVFHQYYDNCFLEDMIVHIN
ncbi:MAG: hypothetical protein IJ193_05410 [Bacilli bacterium]|nr:hypothetical protein [Bacilli bacterium]